MADWFRDDVVAAGYAFARPPIHRPVLEVALGRLPHQLRCRVAVDVGCGAGGSTRPLADIAEVTIGIEPSPAMLVAAKATGTGAHFAAGRAEALPLSASSVDLVLAAGSLDFVDLGSALREARRVLARDGQMIIYDYGGARRFRRSDQLASWYSMFLGRYPPAVDDRQPVTRDALAAHRDVFELQSYEAFDIDLTMSPHEYTDYLMTQTNVVSAVRHGASYEEARAWCLDTLAPFFVGAERVVFDGYIAHLTPLLG